MRTAALTACTLLTLICPAPALAQDSEPSLRNPQWLGRPAHHSPWRVQLGVEQQARLTPGFGPQASTREALWAGVSVELSQRLRGGIESPLWERDSGWAGRMSFQRPKDGGLAGVRGAFSYQLGPQSRITLRPNARRVMVSYAATW